MRHRAAARTRHAGPRYTIANFGEQRMTQRVAFATAAGQTAFVVVLLGALGAYVALGGATSPAPSVAAAQSAPGADIPAAPQAPPVGDPAPTTGNSISPQEAARIALSQVPGAALA